MQSSAADNPIKVVTLVHLSGRRVLLIRARSNQGFYLPGGKPEPRESDLDALAREIDEELGCQVAPGSAALFNRYFAQAYGKPAGTMVTMQAYLGSLIGTPKPRAEISEIRYFVIAEYLQMPDRAPAAELVLADLKKQQLID